MTSGQKDNRLEVKFEDSEPFARALDEADALAAFRSEFKIPEQDGVPCVYMAGNALGLQPQGVKDYIEQELLDWASLGVEGHLHAKSPWLPYHENLTDSTARLVGGLPHEVVVMNSLTVNLHLMMISFYRPTAKRYRILIEGGAFPSDQYAVASQVKLHGYDPAEAVIELMPRNGEETIAPEDILALLEREGHSIALVMLGNCNYLTGQVFDMEAITAAAQAQGCLVGFNLAHGAGNLELRLHDWGVDFAVWCSYKYLNAGPGAIAGCFVHERHGHSFDLPRLAGWWGHDKATRFQMGPVFMPMQGAEGWQLSNPPIFQLAALRASMALFDRAGMAPLRKKSELLTGYMEFLLNKMPHGACRIITPSQSAARGCQLSVRVAGQPKEVVAQLKTMGAICDFREPDIIRVAPAPLYNSFVDVWRFASLLSGLLQQSSRLGSLSVASENPACGNGTGSPASMQTAAVRGIEAAEPAQKDEVSEPTGSELL